MGDFCSFPMFDARTIVDMNTTMRTILSAAAAGALVIGTASGSFAAPDKAKGPKAKLQLASVSIHGHSPINFWDVSADPTKNTVRTLKLRATVVDKKDVLVSPADVAIDATKVAATVLVDVSEFTKKGRKAVVPGAVTLTDVSLAMTREKRKSKNFRAEYTFTPQQQADIKAYLAAKAAAVAPGTKVPKTYICIADADVVGAAEGTTVTNSQQTKKRLGTSKGKAVRDCVQLIDKDPTTTETKTDD